MYSRTPRTLDYNCCSSSPSIVTFIICLCHLKEKPCQENASNLKPRSCVDHLKNGADKCGYYKIYDAAGNGFIVYCDMETEPGAAWTLIVSWSLKNNHFANFRYCYQWIKTVCRPPEKISPFLMALIPWLVLLGRSFIDAQNITLDDDRFVYDKKGCTDLIQRIGVVSQLFWQCRARENYGNLFNKIALCEEKIAKLLPQKRSKKRQKSTHG